MWNLEYFEKLCNGLRVDYFCSLIDLLGILNPISSVFYIFLSNNSVISSDLENRGSEWDPDSMPLPPGSCYHITQAFWLHSCYSLLTSYGCAMRDGVLMPVPPSLECHKNQAGPKCILFAYPQGLQNVQADSDTQLVFVAFDVSPSYPMYILLNENACKEPEIHGFHVSR